jgi:hypothetical protein
LFKSPSGRAGQAGHPGVTSRLEFTSL